MAFWVKGLSGWWCQGCDAYKIMVRRQRSNVREDMAEVWRVNYWRGVCVCAPSWSHTWLSATPWTVACQASPSMRFPRQEYRVGLPFLLQLKRVGSVQSLSRVRLFMTPWTAARQVSLSITNSQILLKLMSIESVMTSNHIILCCPFLLLPSVFPSIRVSSSHQVTHSIGVSASASVPQMNI